MLTADELAYVRAEIGTAEPPTDGELDTAHDRLGTPQAVVAEVLKTRLAALRQQPTSFSVPGEYSESRAGQIEALERQLTGVSGGRIRQLRRIDDAR